MKVRELNRMLFGQRPKKLTDFFIFPNHITYQIWSQLDKLDLIMLASIDETVKNKIFEFSPYHEFSINECMDFDSFNAKLKSEQIDAIIKVFNNVSKIKASPSKNNYTTKLLESLAQAKHLNDLILLINSSNEFSVATLNISKLIIACDYDRNFTEKDPIRDILFSVDSLSSLRFVQGHLSVDSIILLSTIQLKLLEFHNIFIHKSDKSLFIEKILQCSCEMEVLKFECLGIYSNIQNILQIQCHIFDRIGSYAKKLEEIALTISYHYTGNFEGLYSLKTLKRIVIFYNIYIIKHGNFDTLATFVEKLKVLRKKMENVEITIALFHHPRDDGDNNYSGYREYLGHVIITNTREFVDYFSLIDDI